MENLSNVDCCLICGEHRTKYCKTNKINHYYDVSNNLFGFNFGEFYTEFEQDKNNFNLFNIRTSKNGYANLVVEYKKLLPTIEDILNERNKIIESLIFE